MPRVRIRSRIGRLIRAAAALYSAVISAALVFRLIVTEARWGYTALLNHHLYLCLLPALLVFPLWLPMRRRIALLAAPAALAFAVWYAPTFLPREKPPVPADAALLTLLTHNLHVRTDGLEAMVALYRAANADVILLQELTAPAAELLGQALADLYPHQALYPQTDPVAGKGLLSRHPILAAEYWLPGSRGHQRAVLDVAGVPVVIYNVHVPFPAGRRAYQVRASEIDFILDRARAETLPVIVGGDFNLTERAADYRRLTAHFSDAYRQAGRGPGWTFVPFGGFGPLVRVDYVFFSRRFAALSAQVWPDSGGSDHYPVWARLALLPEAETYGQTSSNTHNRTRQ